ncbi:uncharacterized protein LOC108733396 [Agrilus planipennis]|uniref:Uncharacterized protein LOC108733396 n=1 Tax=Agrilus planipennis TaxID=224129 RepID=A0A1W4W7H7_AGRPL|nr:uncharacterized protein LOC108733396 [Agrilus planipennis]
MNGLTVLLVASFCISGSFCQVMVSGTWALESLPAQTVAVPTYAYPNSSPNQQFTVDPSSNSLQNVVYYFPQASPFATAQNPSSPSSLSYTQYLQPPYGAAPSPQKLIFIPPTSPGLNRFYPTYPSGAAPLTPCQLMKQFNEAQNQVG